MKLQAFLEDLRCIIGTLFLIFGVILLALGLFGPEPAAGSLNLNLMTGVAMSLFATFRGAQPINASGS